MYASLSQANLAGAKLEGAIFTSDTKFFSALVETARDVDKREFVSNRQQYTPCFACTDDSQIGASGFAALVLNAVMTDVAGEAVELASGAADSLGASDELMGLLEEGITELEGEATGKLKTLVENLSNRGTKALAALNEQVCLLHRRPLPPRSK